MSSENAEKLRQDLRQLPDLDLQETVEEISLEEVADGQGITETGASVAICGGGCCSLCRS